jgi:PIN domain nuclease of toxin-antitoxin system
MNSSLVLDSHLFLCSTLEPSNLSKATRKDIALAQENNQLLLSSISLWEIAVLSFKKHVHIYKPIKDFLASILNINGLIIKDISAEIAAESILLADNFCGDPAGRLIVATTKVVGGTLVTRDEEILKWASSGHIKVLPA